MIPRIFIYIIFFIYGGLLPVYWSHKALKSGNEKDINKWLIHWIIFTVFLKFLCLTNVLFGVWLPFYNEIILLIFLWLTSSSLKGSEFLYKSHLDPILSKYDEVIESNLTAAVTKSLNVGLMLTSKVVKYVSEIFLQVLKEGNITIFSPVHCFGSKFVENCNDLDTTEEEIRPRIEETTTGTEVINDNFENQYNEYIAEGLSESQVCTKQEPPILVSSGTKLLNTRVKICQKKDGYNNFSKTKKRRKRNQNI